MGRFRTVHGTINCTLPCRWLLAGLLSMTPMQAGAAIIAAHTGDANPGAEGWISSVSAPVTGNPGASDIGAGGCTAPCAYWRVNDPSTAGGSTGGYAATTTPADSGHADGWSLSARVKRIQFTPGSASPPNLSATLYWRKANGGSTRQFLLGFGVDAPGNMTMNVIGAGTYTLGHASDYQLIQVVFDPDRDAADILVNGEIVLPGFAGTVIAGSIDTVFWGSGASATTAQTFWHEVIYRTAPDTDEDGLADMDERRLHGTDPYQFDSDEDGAGDGDEIAALSDPFDPDSDDDGMLDGFEIRYGLNPASGADASMDGDGDGLNNFDEQKYAANPLLPDTDGDTIGDRDEALVFGSNPNSIDSDGDGLGDLEETTLYDSDPARADSDDDGLDDRAEIDDFGTGVLDPDSDDDGLLDGHETAGFDTDPLNPDSDGDGLLDGFEASYQFDPATGGEQLGDPDGDTIDNLAEQNAGSNPLQSDSDGDGLGDAEEINIHGTDPALADSDGDGLGDDFEIMHAFAALIGGDGPLDPDNDGLSNLEEQDLGTDPLDSDSDDDGAIDGQEVNIAGTDPLVDDDGKLPAQAKSGLSYEVDQEPLFVNPPPASRIDILPAGLIQKAIDENDYAAGPNTYGRVVNIEGEAPLWAFQEAWDRGWAACKTTRRGSTKNGSFDACSDWSYTPSDSLCRNGGTIDLEAQSVRCCAVIITGTLNAAASYPGCGTQGDFTLEEVEGLASGNQIPDTIDVPIGLGTRPTQAPPAGNYKVGAEITTDVSMTAELVISAESQDPGAVDLTYVTDAVLQADNTSVAPGDTFRIWLGHTPRDTTAMQSTWNAVGFSSDVEVTSTSKVTADYWTINPNKAVNYPNPDFQESGSITIMDETRDLTGKFIGFEGIDLATIELRLFEGLDVPGVPDFLTDRIFEIDPDIIDFGLPDVSLNGLPTFNDEIPYGTGLSISVPKCLSPNPTQPCPAKPCPFGFAIKGFCFGLGAATSAIKNFFTVGVQQEVVNFRYQLPVVDTPVPNGFWGGYEVDIVDNLFNGTPQKLKTPLRSRILDDGSLSNSVPNGVRPLTNYTDSNPLRALLLDTTLFSSDTMRLQLDLDGAFSGPTTIGWFDKSFGNSFLSITAGVFDVDAAVWIGLDQTLVFRPGLVADISFDTAVMARVQSNHPAYHEASASLVNPGEFKSVPVEFVKNPAAKNSATSWVEVTQPAGGVEVTANYSFRDNGFTNDTRRMVTVAPTLTILKAGLGGTVGGLLSAAVGTSNIHGPRVTLPTPEITAAMLGDKFNDQGEVVDDMGVVIGARNLPGTLTQLGGQQTLDIVERASDSDADGLPDNLELAGCTSEIDADSDDDGLGDGIEDINRNGVVDAGETDPCDVDSDGDGKQDGTERGAMVGVPDPDGAGPLLGTSLAIFVPDPDPTIRTDPLTADIDPGAGNGSNDDSEDSGGSSSGAAGPTVLLTMLLLLLIALSLRAHRRYCRKLIITGKIR